MHRQRAFSIDIPGTIKELHIDENSLKKIEPIQEEDEEAVSHHSSEISDKIHHDLPNEFEEGEITVRKDFLHNSKKPSLSHKHFFLQNILGPLMNPENDNVY